MAKLIDIASDLRWQHSLNSTHNTRHMRHTRQLRGTFFVRAYSQLGDPTLRASFRFIIIYIHK